MTMGVYYNRMLKQTFINTTEARKYVHNELKNDPNAECSLFEIKFIQGT
jgi:hypothetical protein